jgi:acetyl esterase/lipase
MPEDILSRPAPPADLRLAYGDDPNQFFDLRLPPRRNPRRLMPLVINIHGGFWRARYGLNHASHLCAALTSKGLATANVEYRRVGNEGGGWPGSAADICTAFQFLVQRAGQHNFDLEKILVMGHSAGAQLALCVAAREPEVSRVISLAGVVDLRHAYELHLSNDAVAEFLRGTPTQVPGYYREADPIQLSIPQARQWLIHGAADDTVPLDFSRDYVAAKQRRSGVEKENVHLVEIPSAGHYDLIDPQSSAWSSVEQMVLELVA